MSGGSLCAWCWYLWEVLLLLLVQKLLTHWDGTFQRKLPPFICGGAHCAWPSIIVTRFGGYEETLNNFGGWTNTVFLLFTKSIKFEDEDLECYWKYWCLSPRGWMQLEIQLGIQFLSPHPLIWKTSDFSLSFVSRENKSYLELYRMLVGVDLFSIFERHHGKEKNVRSIVKAQWARVLWVREKWCDDIGTSFI